MYSKWMSHKETLPSEVSYDLLVVLTVDFKQICGSNQKRTVIFS